MPKSIAEVAPTASEREQHLRAANDQLEEQVKRLSKRLGERQEFADAIHSAIRALKPPAKFSHPFPKNAPTAIPVIVWSDWHIGQTVGVNRSRYNWAVAQRRMDAVTTAMLKWVKAKRSIYKISECVVLSLADFVSGIIHQELVDGAEFPLPVQVARAGQLHAEHLKRLAAHFANVTVWAIDADNHGRLWPKPRSADKARNNISWLVHEMSQQQTRRIDNIRWERTDETRRVVMVGKTKFLAEHGDTIRGSNYGTPWYGLLRAAMRRAKAAMAGRGETFDIFIIGHLHAPKWDVADGIMVNGALTGTTEYDEDNARSADPAQVAFMVSPSHGPFDWTPFRAEA